MRGLFYSVKREENNDNFQKSRTTQCMFLCTQEIIHLFWMEEKFQKVELEYTGMLKMRKSSLSVVWYQVTLTV